MYIYIYVYIYIYIYLCVCVRIMLSCPIHARIASNIFKIVHASLAHLCSIWGTAFPFRFLFGTSFNMRFTATRSLSTENLKVSGDVMPRQDVKDCQGLPFLFDGLSLGPGKMH